MQPSMLQCIPGKTVPHTPEGRELPVGYPGALRREACSLSVRLGIAILNTEQPDSFKVETSLLLNQKAALSLGQPCCSALTMVPL